MGMNATVAAPSAITGRRFRLTLAALTASLRAS
jgi:hypothetical protein